MDIQRLIPSLASVLPGRAEAKPNPKEQQAVPPKGHGYLGVFVADTTLTEYNALQRFVNADVPLQYDSIFYNLYYRARCAVTPSWRFERALDDYQNWTGKKVAVVTGFQPFFNEGTWKWQEFPITFCNAVYNNVCNAVNDDGVGLKRSIPMITWEPWTFPGRDRSKFLLQEIIDAIDSQTGPLYEYMKKWALDAKKFGKPLILRPMHEMNCDTYPWRGFANGADVDEVSLVEKDAKGNYHLLAQPKKAANGLADGPERYIATWLKIRKLFLEDVGAKNVSFMWCANNENKPNVPWNSIGKYFPGNDNVDWVGFDGYKQAYGPMFGTTYEPVINFLDSYKITKPLAICEIGSASTTDRDEFIAGAFKADALVNKNNPDGKTKDRRLQLVSFFNVNKEKKWNIFSPVYGLTDERSIFDKYYASWMAYRVAVVGNGYMLGDRVKVPFQPYVMDSQETSRLIGEASWDENAERAIKAFNEYKEEVENIHNNSAKEFQRIRTKNILRAATKFEKLLELYGAVSSTDIPICVGEEFDGRKDEIFKQLMNNLNGIPQSKMLLRLFAEVNMVDIGDPNSVELKRRKQKLLTALMENVGNIPPFKELLHLRDPNELTRRKQDIFLTLLEDLATIQPIENSYLEALDQIKNLLFSWNPEWKADKEGNMTEDLKLNYVLNDRLFSSLKCAEEEAKDEKGRPILDTNGKPIMDYIRVNVGMESFSPVFAICEKMISLLNDPVYCKKVQYDDPARWGLMASAYAKEAALLLEYHYRYSKKPNEYPAETRKALLTRINELATKALSISDLKLKANAKKDYWTRKGQLDARDFHLRNELDFVIAQVKAEEGASQEAISTYVRLINNREISDAFRAKVKNKYARLLELKGDRSSVSKALAIFNETVNMDEKNRKSADVDRDRLQQLWNNPANFNVQ